MTAGCRTVPPAPPEQLVACSTCDAPSASFSPSVAVNGPIQRFRPVATDGEPVPHALAISLGSAWHLRQAEAAFESAQPLEKQPSDLCVDHYYQAVAEAWHSLCTRESTGTTEYARAWEIYHCALQRLIITAQQRGRLDPRSGLTVNTPDGAALVPIAYHGFPWRPEDFNQLVTVDGHNSDSLKRYWHHSGLGVPLVALRIRGSDERFMASKVPWATTAVLRPNTAALQSSSETAPRHIVAGSQSGPSVVATLELHDPLRQASTLLGSQQVAIHRDLSAPMAFIMNNADRGWLSAFLQPGTSSQQSSLRMVEPYQPGKIPVVFVHGLLSDPTTWVEIANELRAVPWFVDRYQIWAYRYPTGEPFLKSAADFRHLLGEAVATCDPAASDKSLRQIVLVGHSMGGLISKLQITYSQTQAWDAVANRPLETIRADARVREQLQRLFFFEPQPSVTRVVFVGTPHRGSPWAQRFVGRISSRLITERAEESTSLEVLVRDNPGVFSPQLQEHAPNSVDMLDTDSLVLQAIERLRVNPRVRLHSIIGTGRSMLGSGPADGIVPVSSARHAGVVSERYVDARHSQLNSHPDTMSELLCILRQHVAEMDGR